MLLFVTGTHSSAPAADYVEPEPIPAPPEPEVDRVALQDLLDLWEFGNQVVWPGGLDPLTAKKLLGKRGKLQNS